MKEKNRKKKVIIFDPLTTKSNSLRELNAKRKRIKVQHFSFCKKFKNFQFWRPDGLKKKFGRKQ